MLQSSAYRTNRWPRRSSSRSSSSNTRFESKGGSGPPCGVPSLLSSDSPPWDPTAGKIPRNERKTPPIRNPPRHCGKQPVVIYPVEKFGQVNVYHIPVAVDDVGLRLHHRLVSGAAWAGGITFHAGCRVPPP